MLEFVQRMKVEAAAAEVAWGAVKRSVDSGRELRAKIFDGKT